MSTLGSVATLCKDGEEAALGWGQRQGWDGNGNGARDGDGDEDRLREPQGDTSGLLGTAL